MIRASGARHPGRHGADRSTRSSGRPLLVLQGAVVLLATVAVTAPPAHVQTLDDDPFTSHVLGEWQGEGAYEGDPLTLGRSWSRVLQGRFLRADMTVTMANGSSFEALMYWQVLEPGVYDVLWMDGLGRRQTLRATRDPGTGLVRTTYLDELAEGGPEWRTWEFEPLGPGGYVERLYRASPLGRELLATSRFERREARSGATR
ncbi:MAG: hypothetical protein PVI57_24415 [Gemmatimonadota bacterium]